MGMKHGSLLRLQCGNGYEGAYCALCSKGFYQRSSTKQCIPCDASQSEAAHEGDEEGGNVHLAVALPFLWLGLGLFVAFILLSLLLYAAKRRHGGTFGGGAARAIDFVCFVVLLFQTTLYVGIVCVNEHMLVYMDMDSVWF